MTNEEKSLLTGFLSKTLNMDSEAVASLFNDAGELISIDAAIELDAKRIEKHKQERDNQYNRGVKEGASKIEKELKKKYGYDGDTIGVDMIDEVIQTELTKVSSKQETDIEKNPQFIKAKADFEKLLKEKEAEKTQAIEALRNEFKRDKDMSVVMDFANGLLDELNPILPESREKAKAWRDTFVRDVMSGNFQVNEDGSIIPLDKDSKQLTNEHGHGIDIKDYVKGIAERYFDFNTSTPRSSAGVQPNQSGGVRTFKDEAEFVDLMKKNPSPEEAAKLYEQYKKQFAS